MKTLLFVLIFGFSASTLAANPPQMKSAGALSTAVDHQTQKFTGTLKSGFHFNDKAPNQLLVDDQKQEMVHLKPLSIEFKLPKKWAQGRASLYVCDDAITFCETHHVEVKGNTTATNAASGKKAEANKLKPSKVGKYGFLEDDYQKALKLAEAQKKPILIDFSARWCPGCVRYEKEVFPNPRFSKISKGVIKLKIDVDRFENFALSEKYAINGIPTFVVIDSKEQEINRLVDFHPIDSLEKFLKTIQKDPTPMKVLMSQEKADPQTSLEIGQRLLASGRASESLLYFQKVTPPPPELLQARVENRKKLYQADKENKKEVYAQELREVLKLENTTTRSLGWRSELVELLDPKSEEVKTIVTEGQALADRLLKDSNLLKEAVRTETLGEFTGYENLWVAMLKADLLETASFSEEAVKAAWSEAAKIGKSYAIPPSKSGPALRYLIVLMSAKQFEEAEKYADQILKLDPENTDVKRRKLRILIALKKSDEAISLGQKILPQAEGRNEFWVAESLAKAYVASNKKTEAKQLLTAYLARPEMNEEKMKSSKKTFEDLLKSVN